ncbi:hypothetical protein RchiOBHm_Chr4g0394041 [Rosa chinensis]|uniref:Uncharacterized protein n=1 Tax=Rosa chinensis TaxID=74649 RepID=A0A2P6QR83_ROSCH|nr:hypothetical protein RchiOBHm_Chr4g0394041 [Rosa chinensis]
MAYRGSCPKAWNCQRYISWIGTKQWRYYDFGPKGVASYVHLFVFLEQQGRRMSITRRSWHCP